MSFSFRLRFNLPKQQRLNSDASIVRLSADSEVYVVELRSTERDKVIKEAQRLSIVGAGYKSEQEARAQGELWRSAAELGFAQNGIGVDFGDRGPKSFVTEYALKMMEEKTGQRVLNDTHGLMVFKTDDRPLVFSMGEVTAVVGINADKTVAAILSAYVSGIVNDTKERLAYELYAASFFQQSADARFLMLMMAIETLIERDQRPQPVVTHVEKLITDTLESTLDKEDKHSLSKALEDLRLQSIGQAGRILTARLKDKKYDEQPAPSFFNKCYSLRSKLIHGHKPRPEWKDVNRMNGPLKRLVGDLLSLKLDQRDRPKAL